MNSTRAWIVITLFLLSATYQANAQTQIFRRMFTPELPMVPANAGDWGDYDTDGDFDLAVSGNDFSGVFTFWSDTSYVTLKGNTVYESQLDQSRILTPLQKSMAFWTDIDNDGALDLFLSGLQDGGNTRAMFEINVNGATQHVELAAALHSGSADPGDYDNDGDQDLIISGIDASGVYRTLLLNNQVKTSGGFIFVQTDLPGLAYGTLEWGDYDRDGDLDVLYSGHRQPQQFVTGVFRNDGNGSFADTPIHFGVLMFPDAAWGDYDNDGDLDVLVTGGVHSPFLLRPVLNVFTNQGGTFTDSKLDLTGIYSGAAGWGDYDNDGLLDIVLTGGSWPFGSGSTLVYHNSGGGAFRFVTNLPGRPFGDAFWGDYDGDNDLDVCSTGEKSVSFIETYIRNETKVVNERPGAPTNLGTEIDGSDVTFIWEAGLDDHTPVAGLTYNLRVGTSPGSSDVVPSMADPDSGRRYVARRGNAGSLNRWTIKGLPAGTYYWSVQSIDTGFIGSGFAGEGTFTIR